MQSSSTRVAAASPPTRSPPSWRSSVRTRRTSDRPHMTSDNLLGVTEEDTYTRAVRLLERSAEVGVLRTALGDARDGAGSGVAVTGESGVGKSSLVDALVAESVAGDAEVRVLRAHCDPLDTPRPLGPLRDLQLLGRGGMP